MIKVGNQIINFDKFPDGTCKVNIDCSTLEPYAPIIWLYDSDEEWLKVWFLTQHCRDHEGYRRVLSIPYLPNSRQDRAINNDDVFTLKYFSQMINALHFDKVETFDVHSDVSSALVNHIHVISPVPVVDKVLKIIPNVLLSFPDEGAMLRYRGQFPIPTIYGIKSRNWKNQKIEELVLCGATDKIQNKDILIIDDICGKGSTIWHMAKQLKELGANNIYVYVSHCENTVLGPHIKGKSLLDYDLITKLYTTNSIFRKKHPKIEIVYEF
jgi:ribose-phosphate pyrophosphokinase